tara:strand:- start:36 stop:332 length:297 start_codon:yes stop_codon:yes gene_type:complete
MIIVSCVVAKNGSLGFVKRWLVCRAKPNVPFAGRHKIELKKCAVGKIKNTEGLGNECRVTCCPVLIWFVFLWSLVKMVYFFCFCPSVCRCTVVCYTVR